MKTLKHALFASLLALAIATPVLAEDVAPNTSTAPKLGEVPSNDQNFWGFGIGYVFTKIPISQSQFTVYMAELYYSHYLTDPNDYFRTAVTAGLYGFDFILPMPKVSVEMYLGKPTEDIQWKLGVGGFYDITVGGAAGLPLEFGARIKNRFDISFFTVPAGIDSKRDYLKFIGERDESYPSGPGTANPHYVIYPFYGIFLGFNY